MTNRASKHTINHAEPRIAINKLMGLLSDFAGRPDIEKDVRRMTDIAFFAMHRAKLEQADHDAKNAREQPETPEHETEWENARL